ncbi:oligosaccharide flippase family protein [Methylobacterium sp. BTF04]|uniref:oligosaccharide flippase family protein n=1 Tax=Methylobacterium sp. BTF04 TaxID=2708300 RepID=UPI0013D26A16|nr:oligosaccharide flippase family protein [Methylobacterium sp. BTF04]NEU13480.1 oligosaccharide flippase family protein [Methylobacterium sp. BTF04]
MSTLTIPRGVILSGSAWTIGTYAATVILRFGSNVVLSRLIAPDIFGMVVVISAIRTGADLLSDIGIGQNIVNNPNGDRPEFYNTAWTMQFLRGLVLFGLCLLVAGPLARLYHVPESAIQFGALTLALLGATSTSIFLLQKQLRLATLNMFDFVQDVIGTAAMLLFVIWSPTIWSILLGNTVGALVRVIGSFLLPQGGNRMILDRRYIGEIFSFGKWIFLWSLLGFLSINFDRLYLGSVASLGLLGVYGIARTMADLPAALAGRLGHSLVFPLVSAAGQISHERLRKEIGPLRLGFLLAAAIGIGCAAAGGDFVIRAIYDSRYAQAASMLPLLLLGAWATILCTTNEYVLIGRGKPQYGTAASSFKLAYLVIGLPLAFQSGGMLGAILLLVTADVVRYAVLLFVQLRAGVSFGRQDLLATLALFATLLALTALRDALSLGTPFDGLWHL